MINVGAKKRIFNVKKCNVNDRKRICIILNHSSKNAWS